MQVFAIINKVGTMTNADVNVKNWLIGIQVIVNVNEINYVMLENNWIIKVVSVEKD